VALQDEATPKWSESAGRDRPSANGQLKLNDKYTYDLCEYAKTTR
jgi:hypothetical protein